MTSPAITDVIPRIIHRIWLDEPMPETFIGYGRRWAQLHPSFELVTWSSSHDLPPLINQELFDQAQQIIPRDWVRFRADVVRLELLHRFGGLYVDTDVEPARPVDTLLGGVACLAGRSPQHIAGVHPITNAVMAAIPQHPFVRACIDGLPAAVEAFAGRSLAQMAGPWHLTRTYDAGDWPDVTIIDGLYEAGWWTHHWNTGARKAGRGVW